MDHLASPDPKRSNRNPRNQTPGDQSRAALESLEHCPGRTRVRGGIGDRLPDCIDGILRRVARMVSTHENIQAVNRARHPFDIEDVQISPLDALLRRSAGGSLPCEGGNLVLPPVGLREHPASDVPARSNDSDLHCSSLLAVT